MGSSSERSSAPESQLLSRRTLVRAGATAAWTVPVVQLIGAAPAFATCSGPAPTLSFNSASASWQDATHVRVQVNVLNSSATVDASGLSVTVGIPANVVAGQIIKPTGWNAAAISGNSLTFLAQAPVVHGSFLSFDVLVQVQSGSQGGSVPVGASATCATPITWKSNHPDIVLAAAPPTPTPAVLAIQTLTITRSANNKDVLIAATIKNTASASTGRATGNMQFTVDTHLTSRTLAPTPTVATGSSSGWATPTWNGTTKVASAAAGGTFTLAPQATTTINLNLGYPDGKNESTYVFTVATSCADGATDSKTLSGNG